MYLNAPGFLSNFLMAIISQIESIEGGCLKKGGKGSRIQAKASTQAQMAVLCHQ